MTPPSHSITLSDDELKAAGAVLSRAIEPHSCAPGTSWYPAYTAWRKIAIAHGTLDPEED
jgi:hypothetical protein